MFDKSLFRRHKPKQKAREKRPKMIRCPNCHQQTIKDDSYSCQWCRHPLIK